jgi:hypothetical protein
MSGKWLWEGRPSDLFQVTPQTSEHHSLSSAYTRYVTSILPPDSLRNWTLGSADPWSLPIPLRDWTNLHFTSKTRLSSYSRKPLPEKCILTFICLQKINKVKSVSFKCCWLGCHGYHLIMKDDCYLLPWKHGGPEEHPVISDKTPNFSCWVAVPRL